MAEGESDDSQKTEEPTAKKLEDARKRGQVTLSREVNSLIMLVGVAFVVIALGPWIAQRLKDTLVIFIARPDDLPADGGALFSMIMGLTMDVGLILFMPFLVMVIAAIAGPFIQVGPLVTTEPIKPTLNKISPLSGIKRLFSWRSIVEFIKSILKFAVMGLACLLILTPFYGGIEHLVGMDMATALDETSYMAMKLLIGILCIMVLIAALDYLYQRYEIMKQLRMSKQEIREEYKQMEGDPHVKGRLRQLREQKARQRMMQNVPKADVVITNPTHYAIALKYDQTEMDAPTMLAKGADAVALRIREVAQENKIPIVENAPLARALFEQMEIEQTIPREHFKAVAEIISYVFKLRRNRG